jgi:2-oxo-4-hydroxy-4-carboxy-5-ureidoimidazoline decarboxylase
MPAHSDPTPPDSAALGEFNDLPETVAEARLFACCGSRVWAHEVAAGRPYESLDELITAADAALDRLSWTSVAEAVAAHPRIGELPVGPGREALWSRREQSVAGEADAATATALAEVNREYEQRFGHVFLVFASGRSASELVAVARQRLGNDDETERAMVRQELGKIVRLRLARLIKV